MRTAVMVTAPLICTNKYDNLSIKLVTTAVRMPRVWDESCEKKRERAVLMIQNLPQDEIQNQLFPVLAIFLEGTTHLLRLEFQDYSNTPSYSKGKFGSS